MDESGGLGPGPHTLPYKMIRSRRPCGMRHSDPHRCLQRAGHVIRDLHSERIVSKQKLRRAEETALVRTNRESLNQNLGFASRPFVLCGLPIKRPREGQLLHERRNGHFVLQVTGHPEYGLPWGQDRLVPMFLATLAIRQQSRTITFDTAAEMLDTFGMSLGGSQYGRLIEAFKRVFGATIFFGTDTQRGTLPGHSSIAIQLYERGSDLVLSLGSRQTSRLRLIERRSAIRPGSRMNSCLPAIVT